MAALTHGPRLGVGRPTYSQMKVWLRFDGAETVRFQVRQTGTTDWTTADTQAVDPLQDNTVVLTASGLAASTKYDYQCLAADDTVVASSTFWTLPLSGRFVMYHASDGHGTNQDIYDAIRTDWETNYEPSEIPALIVQTGDLYTFQASTNTERNALDNAALPVIAQIAGSGNACERVPIVFMFDDWDYAGNNSAGFGRIPAFSGEADAQASALNVYNVLWRDQPQDAAPSLGFSHDIAGVSLIVADQRSQRTSPGASVATPGAEGVTGTQPVGTVTVYGAVQREWLRSQLTQNAARGLILFVNGTTVKEPAEEPAQGLGGRDSLGVYFREEKNYVFLGGLAGNTWRNNLIILSGDDHRNIVDKWTMQESAPYTDPQAATQLPGLRFYEFKVISQPDNPQEPDSLFGTGTEFDWSGTNHDCFVRWDVTSNSGGIDVQARITYVHVSGIQDPPGALGTPTDTRGNLGDFFYRSGRLEEWDGTENNNSQVYPPENSAEPEPRFQRAFVDTVMGTMHPRDGVGRDLDGRLRNSRDIDEPGRDDLDRRYPRRREIHPPLIGSSDG